jgi:hypothetical protein
MNNNKFETKFITPIEQIKKILEKDPNAIITPEQIKKIIENPEPIYNTPKKNVKIKMNNISRSEAISRMCDFD